MSEFKIVIDPRAKDSPHASITIEYRPDRESAAIDAEAFAELIEDTGLVPPALDVHPANLIPCGLIKRTGKASWLIRTDTFEFERENSYDDGYGYLRVRPA
jgi:hypothetical protein